MKKKFEVEVVRRPGHLSVDRAKAVEANKELIAGLIGPNTVKSSESKALIAAVAELKALIVAVQQCRALSPELKREVVAVLLKAK